MRCKLDLLVPPLRGAVAGVDVVQGSFRRRRYDPGIDAAGQPDQARASALDLDLRKLRYVVAVAERLHFGRAAKTLYITQPALSRQIRQLEPELGVALFVRNPREVALTPAGEQLAREAPRLLAASRAAVTNARRMAKSDRMLTVGLLEAVREVGN